jgi:hypothetical protein
MKILVFSQTLTRGVLKSAREQALVLMIAAAATTTAAASSVSTFASPTPTAAATWAATAATTTAARSTSSTLAHWARLVYHQRTAKKVLAIAGLNRAITLFVIAKLRESESTRLTGKLVADDLDRIRLESGSREPILQLGLTGLIWKVAYEQFFQGSSLWPYSTAGVRMVGTQQS